MYFPCSFQIRRRFFPYLCRYRSGVPNQFLNATCDANFNAVNIGMKFLFPALSKSIFVFVISSPVPKRCVEPILYFNFQCQFQCGKKRHKMSTPCCLQIRHCFFHICTSVEAVCRTNFSEPPMEPQMGT